MLRAKVRAAVVIAGLLLMLLPALAEAAPSTTVSLTFDDGYAKQFENALPALKASSMHGTFYIITGEIETSPEYMTWAQLHELAGAGEEIAGHTVLHENLTTLSTAEAEREVCNDRVNLINQGFEPTDFAYPNGAFSPDFNPTTEAIVEHCGYNSARTVGGIVSPFDEACTSGCPFSETIPPPAPYSVRTPDSAVTTESVAQLEELVTQAESHGGGWVPLVFHDICENACEELSVSTSKFSAFLAWLKQQQESGAVAVKTVHEVIGGSFKPAVPGPPPTGSSLQNPSLENPSNGEEPPTCWQQGGFGSNTASFTRTSEAHSGAWAGRLTVSNYESGDAKVLVRQDEGECAPEVTPGRAYTLGSWYKSSTHMSLVAFYRDQVGAWHFLATSPNFPATSSWTDAQWTTPAMPSTATAISFGPDLESNGSVTFDDLSLAQAPPTVELTGLISGMVYSGTQTLTAEAGAGTEHVEFLVNGSVVGTATHAPWSVSWNSQSVANGPVTITAKAVESGGASSSASVKVSIDNTGSAIKNASLEWDANEDSVPDCWEENGYGTNSYSFTRIPNAHSGNWAEKVEISSYSSGDRKLLQTMDNGLCAPAVVPGRTYTLSSWYESNVEPFFVVFARNGAGEWNFWTSSANFTPSPSSWTQAAWTTPPVPAGTTNISFGLDLESVGFVSIDDVGQVCASGCSPPSNLTEKASAIAQTKATLNATVNPNGANVTECKFEYAEAALYELTKTYGSSAPCTPSPGSGTTPVAVSAALTSLSPNTTYHYRISATNNGGGESKGADETFTTLPPPTATSIEPKQGTSAGGTEVTIKGTGFLAPATVTIGSKATAVTVHSETEITATTAATAAGPQEVVVSDSNGTSSGGPIYTYIAAPTVETKPPSAVAQTTATLNATVNPNGANVTKCEFEYGTTSVAENKASCATPPGSGTTPVAVSAALTSLSPNTTYHYRISATNNGGGESKGADETFTTLPPPTATSIEPKQGTSAGGTEVTIKGTGFLAPATVTIGSKATAVTVHSETEITATTAATAAGPQEVVVSDSNGTSSGGPIYTYIAAPTVETKPPSAVAQTTATLNATVNPNGANVTKCEFEYGTTSVAENKASCATPPGSGTTPVAVSAALTSLSPNTTYHYRISATNNGGGESKGADETFTTLPPPTATSIEPKQGTSAGGTEVTIKGTGFLAPATVTIGSKATAVTVHSETEITATTAATAAGPQEVVVSDSNGTSSGGPIYTYIAAPTVETKPPSAVAQTTATLNATVNPNGANVTKCEFEYGTTSVAENKASCATPPGSGTTPVAVSAALTSLSPNTTYHYRISATNNGGGESKGADETFTTLLQSCTTEGFCNNLSHFQGEASFSEPNAVALDPSGDVYVGDSAKGQILEFSSANKLLRQFGSEGSGEGQFKGIGAIASNSAGDVYVTDVGNNRVQEFGPAGEHLRTFGSSALKSGQLLAPSGIAIDSSGDVWVLNAAGASGDRIVEFSSEGTELTKFGTNGSGEGQLGQAYGLAISGGNLYVSEEANSRVQELSTSGEFIRAFDEKGSGSGQSNKPYGIATEASSGDLYVTEVGSDRVQVFSAEGAFITAFGSPGGGSGQFSDPKGIALGSTGKVFVADTGNRRLEEWAAGSPPAFTTSITHFSSNEASFSDPNAVAVDPKGDIFVGDSAQDQVLEFNPERKLLRQFGSEGSGEGQFKGIGGIASNSAGDVYVTDVGNNRVQEFGPAGEHLRSFGSSVLKSGQLLAPSGIAIDSSGDVWVLNAAGASGDRIVEFSSEGAELTKFGTNGSGEGQLGQAYGLAISGGHLYVSEEANSRVQELSTSGEFIRAFDEKGSGNGKSNLPYAIATEASSGDLYVTEVGSERVQAFSPEGAFITAFGSPGSGSGQFSDPKGIALASNGTLYVADTGNERLQEWLAGG